MFTFDSDVPLNTLYPAKDAIPEAGASHVKFTSEFPAVAVRLRGGFVENGVTCMGVIGAL